MKKIFIDTSVIYSACNSKIGASARILQLCRQGKVQGYISNYVINEIKKNASMEFDQIGKQRLNFYMLQAHLSITEIPTKEEISECEKVINVKDAPILAAAIKSKAAYLITLDKADFIQTKIKEYVKPLDIVTPKSFLAL